MDPTPFDVLLLSNLYGDLVSDLCAGLVSGLGVVPAANLGIDIGVFEAMHGSAPDIAGRNVANETSFHVWPLEVSHPAERGKTSAVARAAWSRFLVGLRRSVAASPWREEQRRLRGCVARRMQTDFRPKR